MPSSQAYLGSYLTAYVPDPDRQIALGYTTVRFYVASSEGGSYSIVGTATLDEDTHDYSYNHTTGLATDWFKWALYDGSSEGPQSEAVPVGPPRATRLQIRQAVGKRLELVDVYALASASNATTAVVSELIDPDASAHSFGNRFARVVAGTAAGQTRRVRSGSTGYTVASGTIVLNRDTDPDWVAADTVEFWKADGDRDPSAAIDAIMNDIRHRLWWEDTYYFTSDASVAEYVLPAIIPREGIKRIDYVAGTYPDEPNWRPVGWWDARLDAGALILSLGSRHLGHAVYSGDTIFRVIYNRPGDRMDSDTDYWEVPLEWAQMEVAYEYLKARATPGGGKEDVSDARAAAQAILETVMVLRRVHMPSWATRQVLPR